MGFLEDTKETLNAAGEKAKRGIQDTGDRVKDKYDEFQADAKVKKAEADRDSVENRNEVKEKLRDS